MNNGNWDNLSNWDLMAATLKYLDWLAFMGLWESKYIVGEQQYNYAVISFPMNRKVFVDILNHTNGTGK